MSEESYNKNDLDAELADLFAQFWLRHCSASVFVDWAVRELVRGKDTPDLRILAGLAGADEGEVMMHLERALKELKIEWPDSHDGLLKYCKRVAGQIIDEEISPSAGYKLIYEVILELAYPDELLGWLNIKADFYRWEGTEDEAKQIDLIILAQAKRFVARN